MSEPIDAEGRSVYRVEGETLVKFMLSTARVQIILGPLGSGKTLTACLKCWKIANEQQPGSDGIRRTRVAIIRNSYPSLRVSTVRTWLSAYPEDQFGRLVWSQPPRQLVTFGRTVMETDFLALDKPEDVRKLRSTEYSFCFFNEVQYIDREIFDEALSRTGRYPPRREGGPTWHGIIADANAPDEDHWLAYMIGQVDLPPGTSEEERARYKLPPNWTVFEQPAALLEVRDASGVLVGYDDNPRAENLANLPAQYYPDQLAGKSKAWIDSRLMVKVALYVEGSAVWPMFNTGVHVARDALVPVANHPVIVGLDFGRMPAAIFMQPINNRVYVQFELLGINEGAVTFAPRVKRFLAEHYPDHQLRDVRLFGDPKGQDRGQNDDRTAYEIFAANGLPVRPAPGLRQNMIATRVDAVAKLLNEMHDARPRFVLSPFCRTLKVAMAGRYHLVREETGELKPKKDRYSNPCDALQYGVLGLGEGRDMIGLGPLGDLKPVRGFLGRKSMRRVA